MPINLFQLVFIVNTLFAVKSCTWETVITLTLMETEIGAVENECDTTVTEINVPSTLSLKKAMIGEAAMIWRSEAEREKTE